MERGTKAEGLGGHLSSVTPYFWAGSRSPRFPLHWRTLLPQSPLVAFPKAIGLKWALGMTGARRSHQEAPATSFWSC